MATEDFWDKSADAVLVLTLALGYGFCALVIGWQVLHWLQTGEWQPLPFLVALEFIGVNTESAYAPKSWIGMAKVARFLLELPMSIMVPVCGVVLALAWKIFVSSGTAR